MDRVQRRSLGFTLIELLISLVIMSAVITLAVGAFRLFQPSANIGAENTSDNISQLIGFKQVSQSIRSVMYYYFDDNDKKSHLAFWGANDYFVFVTNQPVSQNLEIAVAVVLSEVSPITGLTDVVYCEYPLGNLDLNRLDPDRLDCSQTDRYRFLSGVRQIELSYFGWENRGTFFQAQSDWFDNRIPAKPRWFSVFFAESRSLLPFFVKLKIFDAKGVKYPSEMYFRLTDEDPRIASAESSGFGD